MRLSKRIAGTLVILILAACDGLLDVDLPGELEESGVFNPQMAEVLVNSAISDFECSYSMYTVRIAGMEDSRAQTSGYWQDFVRYGTLRPGGGRCSQNSSTGTSYFQSFQSSRLMAEEAYERLLEWTDTQVADRQEKLATLATYLGLYYQIFGETYCEFAPTEDSELMMPSEVLGLSEEWFTRALDQHIGGGDFEIVSTSSLRQLARLGRARARLAMGDLTGAAADASAIQPGFTAWVTRDASVVYRWNHVFRGMNVDQWGSISEPIYWLGFDDDLLVSAGYQDLTISQDGRHTVGDGVPDPRVPVEYVGAFAQDGETDQYNQTKYQSVADPQRLASWEEAQLILAEIEGGQAAVARINAIRDVNDLPHFSSSDEKEILAAVLEERRREFFYEARHYADKLRHDLWFPRGEGWNHKGQRFESVTCLLMPESAYELNPNIPDNYIGPDYTDPNFQFELTLDSGLELGVHWPVPSSIDP